MSTTIKSIQDVMRKDVGVDGDAQRIGQLVFDDATVLFFEKGRPTSEVWYYEHPYPEGYIATGCSRGSR